MSDEHNPDDALLDHSAQIMKMAAWHLLTEGIKRELAGIVDTVGEAWDGEKWSGGDEVFGKLVIHIALLVVAAERIIPPEYIEQQHKQFIDSMAKYHEFMAHAARGAPNDAARAFAESKALADASAAGIRAAEGALGGGEP